MKYSPALFKTDLPAGLVVFLVAVPLCLGIAHASEAPLMSGIIAGISGGIVTGLISGSHTSVSGPAAGLTAVVAASITTLSGDFQAFLLAVVIAGALQVLLGLLRGGFIAEFVPSSVINGLLAAIGIIIIMKQIPHAVGYDADEEGDFSFFQHDQHNTLSELGHMFERFTYGALIIFSVSLFILLLWEKTKLKNFKFLPGALVAVAAGILLNECFLRYAPTLGLAEDHLVQLPKAENLSAVTGLLTFPNFSFIGCHKVWTVAFTIFLVASLETLLNLNATDKLDPEKKHSPPNRELIAQGAGNMVSGLLGGIPVTSVIVRSSVNINTGAKSKISAVSHGLMLALFVVLAPGLLNKIPLSCLAAILILTGFKLTKVKLYKQMWAKGLNQFLPFVLTILAILFTDLLIGVMAGLAFGLLFILRSNFKNPFASHREVNYNDYTQRIQLAEQVSFLNKAALTETLSALEPGSKVVLDATRSKYIDPDALDVIRDFMEGAAVSKNISVKLLGFKDKYEMESATGDFVNVLTKDIQSELTPDKVIELLKSGNERFVNGESMTQSYREQVLATSTGQHPMAVILSCIDSRTTTEIVFDLRLGDIFSVRVAGNVINPEALGSMEFGCNNSGAKVIMVLGHTACGAIKGAVGGYKAGNLASIIERIEPSIRMVEGYYPPADRDSTGFMNEVTKVNVLNMMKEIPAQSSILREMIEKKQIILVGGIYDVGTGKVEFITSSFQK